MLQLDGIWILEMLQSDGIFGVAVLIVWRKGLSELSAKHAGTSSADVSYTLQHIVTGCWSQTFEGPANILDALEDIGSQQPEKIPRTEVAATAPNLRESQRKQVPDTGCNSDVESLQNARLRIVTTTYK